MLVLVSEIIFKVLGCTPHVVDADLDITIRNTNVYTSKRKHSDRQMVMDIFILSSNVNTASHGSGSYAGRTVSPSYEFQLR